MAYWLLKSEPGSWSWDDQKNKGAEGEPWTGVRNHLAKKHMMSMKLGDKCFFYHSIDEKRIVGIVEVSAEAHPDHTDPDGRWFCVDVTALTDMPQPVTLDDCKREPALKDMVLVNNSRLSVQPVTEEEWAFVCRMGKLEAPHP